MSSRFLGEWMPFIAGLDLGQARDYSALLVVEQITPRAPYTYHVRHIERWPLGTQYPTIVSAVSDRMAAPLLRRQPLIIDGTGCGRPVVDLFRRVPALVFRPVLITGGDTASKDDGSDYWRVPKRDLVGVVQVLLQSERLKIAEVLPEARALTSELLNFQTKITESANDTYGAWREGTHDDLVLGLALALWWAEHRAPAPIVAPGGAARRSQWSIE